MIDLREKEGRVRLKRPCKRCACMFRPNSPYSHTCEKCKDIIEKERVKHHKQNLKRNKILK